MQFCPLTAWEPAGEKHSWDYRQDRVPIFRLRALSYHSLQQPVAGKKSVSEPLILVWRKMVLLSHCMSTGHVEFCQVHKAAEMLLHTPGKAYALTPMCMRTSEEQVNTDMCFGSACWLPVDGPSLGAGMGEEPQTNSWVVTWVKKS